MDSKEALEKLDIAVKALTFCEDACATYWSIKVKQDEEGNYLYGEATLTVEIKY